MSLIRLPFILSAALGMQVAVTAPHTAAPDEQVKSSTFREAFLARTAIMSPLFTVALIWSVALLEISAILSPYLPYNFPSLPAPTNCPPVFIVGSLLVTSAGLLRWQCYRTLGRFFTFELSVKKDHRLVTQGPYSVVRHPSYSGTLLLTTGMLLVNAHPESWLRTSGVLDFTPLKIILLGWAGVTVAIATSLFARSAHEDQLMRKEFGAEWDRWASTVRYRIIPGIY
ncbi:hypothetical protein HYDPIDRAFT_138568 [Hydnomerulius pinastri MD-312]|uniref:Protein-S-isoprenylcysteine O-methyltransferase n=1 Tax=Hydnomerulius pinastri MD-312 TaxID=994086 RepID=A0A0C9V5L3_9AGAM|nr:hypothetical protein HYDPIDRAFT_138568 [Hydnomerulius pinastri MD-312]